MSECRAKERCLALVSFVSYFVVSEQVTNIVASGSVSLLDGSKGRVGRANFGVAPGQYRPGDETGNHRGGAQKK